MKKTFTVIKQSLIGIYLIDKILILYMIILLAYTAIHLFDGTAMQESTTVDTIIRTSASAIFSYFISNNFIKGNSGTKSKNKSALNNDGSVANEIAINQSDVAKQLDDEKNAAEDSKICCSRLQIIVVSGIGLISLLLLLISRTFTQLTPEFSATVSQLRDFLSACIVFLISCGKSK